MITFILGTVNILGLLWHDAGWPLYMSAVRLCQDRFLRLGRTCRLAASPPEPPPLSSISHSFLSNSLSLSFLNKCLYPTLCFSLSPYVPASPHSNCLMPLFAASCSQTQMYNRADAHIALFILAQEGDEKPARGRERFVLIACMAHHKSHNAAAATHSAEFDNISTLLVTWCYGIPDFHANFAHLQPVKFPQPLF